LALAAIGCAIVGCGDRTTPVRVTAIDATSPDASPDATPAPAIPAEVTLELSAACDPGSDRPSALAVALSVPIAGRPVFRLDDVVMGTAGMAALITEATADDARGSLPLARRVRDGVLELAPTRDAVGVVTLRYRARSVATTADGAREGVRHDETGIGGHGRHFLVLPASQRRYRMRIAWGEPSCPNTTAGDGSSAFGGPEPVDIDGELVALREGAYFWGQPQRASIDDGAMHLRLAWFGKPAFDVAAASQWASRAYAAERAFFGDGDPSPYRVFVRVLDAHGDRANGVAHETSLLTTIGPRTTLARRLQVNLAHEMFHRWLGMRLRLDGPEGTAYWFTEGFTVHYSNRIAFRAGLLTVDEFLESLNDIAARHFDNKRATASNDEIRRDFYRDPAVSIVPYTRGALYAVELDAALRRASGGKRTLDDVLRALYQSSRAQGDPGALPADAVRALVKTELGRDGVARYDAVIVGGGHPAPPPDAYGPCFARIPRSPAGFAWKRVPDVDEATCRAW
jgi:hypothetical protein